MEDNRKTLRFSIDGMTCINCQNHVEEALNDMEGVFHGSVNYKTGKAEVVCDESVTYEQIAAVVQSCGYRVAAPAEDLRKKLVFSGAILLVIVFLYLLLNTFGILNLLVPSQLADSTMGYGMLFVVGLLTSVHCIAMCGGINLSQCLPKQAASEDEKKSTKIAILPAILYNLGRVISYTVIGFVMGLIGFAIGGGNSQVGIPILLQGILKLIAGILMVVMGLNMLGIFPWLRKFIPHTPTFLAKKINGRKRKGGSSFFIGILNGIMPCGPLQSMWIVALATGNPFSGAFSMFLFALGTVPLMMGLGALVIKLGQKFSKAVTQIGSVLVVVMGLAMLSQGGGLTGWLSPEALLVFIVALFVAGLILSLPFRTTASKVAMRTLATALAATGILVCVFQNAIFLPQAVGDVAVVEGDIQTVKSTLIRNRYPEITVTEGIPVKWSIFAEKQNINGCNNEIVIQDFGITYTFHEGENVIEFTPTKTGTISYCCWMGMIYGTIHVVAA